MLSTPSSHMLDIHWETLDAVIQGRSSIDLSSMPTKSPEEAKNLIYQCGYDLDDPLDASEVTMLFQQAVDFIETRFLSNHVDWAELGENHAPTAEIPAHIKDSLDIITLIMTAATAEGSDRYWSCAILKVMLTLSHLHNMPVQQYASQASDAIVSNFHQVLSVDRDGCHVLEGTDDRELTLYGFETKIQKARDSMLIKLLGKKENIAEDIWDLVGVRLITNTPQEALIAVDILREQKVFTFPNIVPSRSRNTLLDYESFKSAFQEAVNHVDTPMNNEDFNYWINQLPVKPATQEDFKANDASLPSYRAIHITCRYQLRLPSLDNFKTARIAFPYEIQILDRESYLASKAGDSAHTLYKQNQLINARRRTLGKLLLKSND